MSNERDDGGPAFPVAYSNEADGPTVMPSAGMSMRDYFAAKALMGLLACNEVQDYEEQKLLREDYAAYCLTFAESAYEMADAMLAARSK